MNNNQMNFDPMTGQPINQNTNSVNNNVVPNTLRQDSIQPTNQAQQVNTLEPAQQIQPTPVNNIMNTQQQIQNIPTVEQSKQEFINNTQANNTVKKEEKKEGPNIIFIIVLFVIIFASILFLFPYLLKVL